MTSRPAVFFERFSFACSNAEPPNRRDREGFLSSVSASWRHGVEKGTNLTTPLRWTLLALFAVHVLVRYATLRRDGIPVVFRMVLASFLLVAAHHRHGESG